MKVYHTLKFGSYNAACAFLEGRVHVTKVTCPLNQAFYRFWVGDEEVAKYYESFGELVLYRDLNSNNRCYGRLH
jgi:hypothetical protein